MKQELGPVGAVPVLNSLQYIDRKCEGELNRLRDKNMVCILTTRPPGRFQCQLIRFTFEESYHLSLTGTKHTWLYIVLQCDINTVSFGKIMQLSHTALGWLYMHCTINNQFSVSKSTEQTFCLVAQVLLITLRMTVLLKKVQFVRHVHNFSLTH